MCMYACIINFLSYLLLIYFFILQQYRDIRCLPHYTPVSFHCMQQLLSINLKNKKETNKNQIRC